MGSEIFVSIWVIIAAFGIPSAVTGLGFWAVKKSMEKSEKKREVREQTREDYQVLILRTSCSSLSLGIATAETVRDGHSNGNMSGPLEKAKRIKLEQDAFMQKMQEQGVKNLF